VSSAPVIYNSGPHKLRSSTQPSPENEIQV
jgi:hypothetical protein